MKFFLAILFFILPQFVMAHNCEQPTNPKPISMNLSGQPVIIFSTYSFKVGGKEEELPSEDIDQQAVRARVGGCMYETVNCLNGLNKPPQNGKILLSFDLLGLQAAAAPKISNVDIVSKEYSSSSFKKCMINFWSDINLAQPAKLGKVIKIKIPIEVTVTSK